MEGFINYLTTLAKYFQDLVAYFIAKNDGKDDAVMPEFPRWVMPIRKKNLKATETTLLTRKSEVSGFICLKSGDSNRRENRAAVRKKTLWGSVFADAGVPAHGSATGESPLSHQSKADATRCPL